MEENATIITRRAPYFRLVDVRLNFIVAFVRSIWDRTKLALSCSQATSAAEPNQRRVAMAQFSRGTCYPQSTKEEKGGT